MVATIGIPGTSSPQATQLRPGEKPLKRSASLADLRGELEKRCAGFLHFDARVSPSGHQPRDQFAEVRLVSNDRDDVRRRVPAQPVRKSRRIAGGRELLYGVD